MRVLLTGGCGLIGGAVARLGAGEHSFVLFDSSLRAAAAGGVSADVRDRDALLRAAEGCDAIVHAAALHGGFADTASPRDYLEANVLGTQNVFDAALAQGARRVVLARTLTINIGLRNDHGGGTVIDEDAPVRADHIYPVSKLMAEELGRFHARHRDLEVVQLRYSYVREDAAVNYPMGLLGRCVDLDDAARATLLALTRPGLTDRVLLIAADTPLTAADLPISERDPWGVIERHWPGSTRLLKAAGHAVDSRHLSPIFRIERAKEALGWSPRVTFESLLHGLGWRRAARVPA